LDSGSGLQPATWEAAADLDAASALPFLAYRWALPKPSEADKDSEGLRFRKD